LEAAKVKAAYVELRELGVEVTLGFGAIGTTNPDVMDLVDTDLIGVDQTVYFEWLDKDIEALQKRVKQPIFTENQFYHTSKSFRSMPPEINRALDNLRTLAQKMELSFKSKVLDQALIDLEKKSDKFMEGRLAVGQSGYKGRHEVLLLSNLQEIRNLSEPLTREFGRIERRELVSEILSQKEWSEFWDGEISRSSEERRFRAWIHLSNWFKEMGISR
jgi:hypothetical protein